ncbi:DMT family transporter [Haloarcula montana]|uniref:DMT family transporter n=1 Tax=Haloarcula montana TaxID=3111776 RepID=UPI002D792699|nr:EamA family transporter [Haloarcula sp. GH36]
MRFRNALLFVALAVAWGSAFTAIKAGLDYFPPVLFAAFRYDLAGLLMLGYAVYTTDRWRPRTRPEWTLVGIGGLFMIAAYHAFLFVGELGVTSAVAAIVVSLSPVLTTAFARVFLPDERLTALGVVGLLVGFVGVAVLSNPEQGAIVTSRTVSLFLVFLAATAFALGSVLTRRVDADLPIETMEAWSMLLGAVIMHGASAAIGESFAAVRWEPRGLFALGYLVVVASALGFLVYFDLLERLGPIEINLVSYAAPIVAAITGVLFLPEELTAATVAGFALIFAGFVLLKRDAIRAELIGTERPTKGDH